MLKSFHLLRRKKHYKQIGISENATLRCIAWIQDEQPQVFWQKKEDDLFEFVEQHIGPKKQISAVLPIPPQYIWRKVCYLPFIEQNHLLYKQIIDILKKELPIDLDRTYFDYKVERQAEYNRVVVSLFVLRREYADTLFTPYNTIMDCQLNCYMRGFKQLNPAITNELKENSYQVEDLSFQFEQGNLELNPEKLREPVYKITDLAFPEEVLDRSLYLCAIGASLWNGKG